jgi:hypothetical protein
MIHPSFPKSFVMAVVSFQRAALLFAAMGAIDMATFSLLLQPNDLCGFYGDVTITSANSRDVIHV